MNSTDKRKIKQTKTIMETVVKCEKVKEWNGKPIYSIGLSDGQGGESFAVQIPIGTPVSDLIIEDSQWGKKIKMKNKPAGGGFQGKQRGSSESFALSYAKDLVAAGKVELKNTLKTADWFYNWLEGKKINAPTIPAQTAPSTTAPHPPQVAQPQTAGDDLPF